MKILEFDIPSPLMPEYPYYIDELNLVLISTNLVAEPVENYHPKYITKLILYDYDPKTFKKIIIDLIVFMNFLNQNYPLFYWMRKQSFANPLLYQKDIENMEKYIQTNHTRTDWYLTLDFDKYPLMEVTPRPNEINFGEYFLKFYRLQPTKSKEFELRNLIQFFAYNYLSSTILSQVYNNTNLYINNSFILIESLINLEGIDQSGYEICPNCKYRITKKREMKELVKEYITPKLDDPQKQIFLSILKKHYNLRNKFSHTAKYGNANQKIDEMIKKLGRNSFSLLDEIEHADASSHGLIIVNNLIRFELLLKLEEVI